MSIEYIHNGTFISEKFCGLEDLIIYPHKETSHQIPDETFRITEEQWQGLITHSPYIKEQLLRRKRKNILHLGFTLDKTISKTSLKVLAGNFALAPLLVKEDLVSFVLCAHMWRISEHLIDYIFSFVKFNKYHDVPILLYILHHRLLWFSVASHICVSQMILPDKLFAEDICYSKFAIKYRNFKRAHQYGMVNASSNKLGMAVATSCTKFGWVFLCALKLYGIAHPHQCPTCHM